MRRACLTVAVTLSLLLSVAESHGAEAPSLRRVVITGQAVPGGGTFDRFSVESLPIVAPINNKGQVAFFATILRGRASEGYFLASGPRISKLAADGDPAPGAGVFSGFGRHPVPALNDGGELAFVAAIAGARAVEGIFVASPRGTRAIALAGGAAPEIASGTFANLDAPALNDRGDVAFLATVRRGRETVGRSISRRAPPAARSSLRAIRRPRAAPSRASGCQRSTRPARWRSPPSSRDARCPAACSSRALAGSGCSSAPATRRRSGGSSRNSPSASP